MRKKEDEKASTLRLTLENALIWFHQPCGRPFYSHFTDKLRLRNSTVFQAYPAGEDILYTWTRPFELLNRCMERLVKWSVIYIKNILGEHLSITVWCANNFKSWIQAFVEEIQRATEKDYMDGGYTEKNGRISENKEEY